MEAQSSDHELFEDGIGFIANPRVVVSAGAYDSEYRLCQLVFGKRDGSLMVVLPDIGASGGVLSAVSIPPEHVPGEPLTYSFSEGVKGTRHNVKFSHHPDGRVHFSQDGKIFTRIKRESFPLRGTIGKVFELHCYLLSGFESFDYLSRDLKKGYVRTRFSDGLPRAVVLSVEWRRKSDLRASIEPAGDAAGPLVRVQHRKSGERFTAFWVGQPPGFPERDNVLMISVTPTKSLPEVTEPTFIFMGGWDPHETTEGDPPIAQTGFLSAVYPARDIDEVEARVGSIDYVPELS